MIRTKKIPITNNAQHKQHNTVFRANKLISYADCRYFISSVSLKLVGAVSNGLRVLCLLCIRYTYLQFSINIQFVSDVLVCACDTSIGVTLVIIFERFFHRMKKKSFLNLRTCFSLSEFSHKIT